MTYDMKLNYSADIVRCVRGMPTPDLTPSRYIVFSGLFLRVEGSRKPGRRWTLPDLGLAKATPWLVAIFVAALIVAHEVIK